MNKRKKKTWFISDTHWNHANIIKYSKRPFLDVREMNEALIENWNSVVDEEDDIYHLGDVGFDNYNGKICDILRRLKGNKYLIIGNHDEKIVERNSKFCSFFQWIRDTKTISVNGQNIVLHHYAQRVWKKSHHGAWHLYGHSHGSLPDDPNSLSFDVGVDCHNYFPISFEEVARIMKTKKWKPIDHHGKEDDST